MDTVMIVEDEQDIALLLKYNLEKEGYKTICIAHGNRVVAAVEKYLPSLILLDWMLPEMSGLELCKIIRNNPELKNIPIIMLTAKGQEEDKVVGLSASADDYVTKPFSLPELLARIRTNLRRISTTTAPVQKEYIFKAMEKLIMKIAKKNNFFNALVLMALLPLSAHADDGEFAFEASSSEKAVSTTNYDSTKLFNFSPELLSAAENCTAYSEDFTVANPELKQLGSMFGGMDFSIPVNITGKKDGLCRFTVEYQMAGSGSHYDCGITGEQRNTLVQAMKDRSTEKRTETFISYLSSSTDADGRETHFPTKTTVSGNLFDVTLARILGESCKLTEIQTTEEETAQAEEEALTFSGEFQKSLSACSPATETKQFLFFSQQLDILGRYDNSCHLKFNNFTLNVPLAKAAELKSFNDIETLLNDKNIAVYTPEYMTDYLLFALDKCLKSESSAFSSGSVGSATSSFGSISTVRELKYAADGTSCSLEFINTLDRNGTKEDYSLNCHATKGDLTEILVPYEELLKLYGEKSSYENGTYYSEGPATNEQTQPAGEELFKILQTHKLCTKSTSAGFGKKAVSSTKSALIKWKE